MYKEALSELDEDIKRWKNKSQSFESVDLYNQILKGSILFLDGKYAKSEQIYDITLIKSKEQGALKNVQTSLEKLYQIKLIQGDSIKALNYILEYNLIQDSLQKLNNLARLTDLEMANEIKILELNAGQNKVLLELQLEKSKIEKVLFVMALFLFIVLAYYLFRKIQNKYRQSISQKSKEITLYAAKISSRNEAINNAINKLKEKIETSESDDNKNMASLLSDLKFELKNQDFWADFELRFKESNSEFIKNLLEAHPNLTKNEIRLCTFMKLNLSSKEISSITKKTVNSINVSKHRLKTAINLPQNQRVDSYIARF